MALPKQSKKVGFYHGSSGLAWQVYQVERLEAGSFVSNAVLRTLLLQDFHVLLGHLALQLGIGSLQGEAKALSKSREDCLGMIEPLVVLDKTALSVIFY